MSLLQSIYEQNHDFSSLTNINNVDVLELERRAAGIEDKSQDRKAWRVRSFAGFLGEHERLREVLAKDWHTVLVELETSHQELAAHLIEVLQQTEMKRQQLNRGPTVDILLQFETKLTSSAVCSAALRNQKPQQLQVSRKFYAGNQFSFFANLTSHMDDLDKTIQLNDDNDINNNDNDNDNNVFENVQKWNDEYRIKNVFFDLEVLVGGRVRSDGVAVGVPSYIQRYGFYEGGDANPYRVSPAILATILSGNVTQSTIAEVRARHRASIDTLLRQKTLLCQEFHTFCLKCDNGIKHNIANDSEISLELLSLEDCKILLNFGGLGCVCAVSSNETNNERASTILDAPTSTLSLKNMDVAALTWFKNEMQNLNDQNAKLCAQTTIQLEKLNKQLLQQ